MSLGCERCGDREAIGRAFGKARALERRGRGGGEECWKVVSVRNGAQSRSEPSITCEILSDAYILWRRSHRRLMTNDGVPQNRFQRVSIWHVTSGDGQICIW